MIVEIKCPDCDDSKQIIRRVCLNRNCKKIRIMCERCLNNHKDHFSDCLLIDDIPEKLNLIKNQQYIAQAEIKESINKFMKGVKTQIEQKFNYQQCPLFKFTQESDIYYWKIADFNEFSKQASLLNFQVQMLDDSVQGILNELNQINFDEKSFERLFVPSQQQGKKRGVFTQGLSARSKNGQGMTNFQKEIQKQYVHQSIEIEKETDSLISIYGMEKMAILEPNLMKLAEQEIKIVFQYEGNSFHLEGNNKFGLYTGGLNYCSFEEKNHFRDLILINDQARYNDIQILIKEEVQKLFFEDRTNILMLVYNKGQTLSIVNIQSGQKAEIPLEKVFVQAYFCFSLSCSAKIKFF